MGKFRTKCTAESRDDLAAVRGVAGHGLRQGRPSRQEEVVFHFSCVTRKSVKGGHVHVADRTDAKQHILLEIF